MSSESSGSSLVEKAGGEEAGLQMGVPRAVLWDMDGTLIDSEDLHWASWRETMANQGIAITREQFLSTFGQRNDSILPQWLGAAATPERIERIANAKEESYRQSGSQEWNLTAAWGYRLVAAATRAGMAAGNCFGGAADEHRGSA